MIRTLLATTAVATLLATGAIAQENTTAAPAAPAEGTTTTVAPAGGDAAAGQAPDAQTMSMNGYLASNLLGENVYNGMIQDAGAMQNGQAAQPDAAAGQANTQQGQAADANAAAQDGAQAEQTAETAETGTTTAGETAGQDGEMAAAEGGEGNTQMSQDGQSIQTVETIGDVNDLVIGQDGRVEAIVVGVGGFLGIGEKDVALNFSEIQWATGQDGDPYIVVNATRESLEALPEFDRSQFGQPAQDETAAANTDGTTNGGMAPAAGAGAVAGAADNAANATGEAVENAGNTAENAGETVATTTTGETTTTDQAAQNNATDTTQTGAIDRSQLQEVPQDQLTAETLVGTTVYGANDENIGEIGDIVLTQDGQVDAVLVDVGGFLGIGEKRVAVGMDRLQFLQDGNGNRYLYTNFSEEQLNAQAAYDEGSYSQNRDQQRLIVQ